jgi:trimethylamine--corrinoid protein Co-methyltransferase
VDLKLGGLTDAERELVLTSAFGVLERTGMRMKGAAHTLALLEERGAAVDRETGVVRMSEELVRSALASLPETMLMAGATPEQDVFFDRTTGPFFNPGGCMAKTLDFRSGELRASTLLDIREGTVVMDRTPELDIMWTFVRANDVPEERRELTEYHTYLTNTSKPLVLVTRPSDPAATRRIAEILGDGLDGFRRRPRLTILCAAAAPLAVNGVLLDTTCECARLGMPVWTFTMPISGVTGPVTLAGMLVQMWAETLGLVTAVQTAAPGAAILSCCGPGILDMRTSTISLGSLENTILGVASVGIAHHLRLPVHNSGMSTDAKSPTLQAGYEKGMKALSAAYAGADVISAGFGCIASSSMFHLPMVPIDAEIARMIRRIVAGTTFSPETMLLDVIERVGPGGNYLKEKTTRQLVQAGEHFYPVIGDRLAYEQWVADGRTEADRAREAIERILAEHDAVEDPTAASRLRADQLEALAEVCAQGD